jgi:ribonuclease P/MRP protein subunit RPP40
MRFNISKCKVMPVGREKVKSTAEYFMMNEQGDQQEREVTRVERDLGVMISDDLKLAAARANRVLGMFKKTFKSRGLSLWKSLYTTYIRPHLEFAIQAWSPYQAGDILTLERIQRRATKTITEISNLPYTERLKRLKLTSLEERRERGDLFQLFKFSRGIDSIEWQNKPTPAPAHHCNGTGV